MHFAMTVDVDPPANPKENFMIEKGVTALLNIFRSRRIKATFFVPSIVAENFSSLILEIVGQKHEIACHGLKHDPLEATLDINKQFKNIKIATHLLESVTGIRPLGFRAPLFNINKNCWIALYKNGYIYDSSLVYSPFFRRFLFLKKPFILVRHDNLSLIEIPVSVNPLLPFPLGGAYLRILGMWWSTTGIKLNSMFKKHVTVYIHPKDVVQRVHVHSWLDYRNISNCLKMLEKIIDYAKQCGAKFLTTCELAKLYLARFSESEIS